MQLNTHLNFNGQCEAAFKFYEQALGGKITSMHTFDSTPAGPQVPADLQKKIMHAEMKIGDAILMGADAPAAERYQAPQGFSITFQTDQPAEADRVFEALAQNAQVKMPIQKTFWAARFGMLVDQFGIPWMVNCSQAASANSGQ
ncbi:MAG: VOC family protein [Candidatus Acidiferrales bacterium]